MRLYMAPMEGVIDHHFRDLMTGIGGIDICVTEFVRVSEGQLLPERVFTRLCPELDNASNTRHGTPVRLQLLGGDPEALALNAVRAAHMGAAAIDLNFGCPAKTVNRNDGGASLLQSPERIFNIVAAVRKAVPANTPVTAKMRLGFEDRSLYLENAMAAAEGGANELAVHARSKADGYRPPAYWDYIGRINEQITIPVIANGEIWSPEDWLRCRQETRCEHFMLGRGLLARPDLALAIKACAENVPYQAMSWLQVTVSLMAYYHTTKALYPHKFLGNRVKQWLAYLKVHYPQATVLFETIKRLKNAEDLERAFEQHINELHCPKEAAS